ncbi:MAG: tRNA (adenosine(37)-N6)-threonylcarbamoyltransferase complex ATPase subunit type 1 TsaE [Candidatus Pacebacteria bacterium]|nr:tRNA (adenosine(37)-N6)-threonylcarbamoyltransferase complex ATPase subunit type 1 TsaE [Candidatus Paceibacterota bacterium]
MAAVALENLSDIAKELVGRLPVGKSTAVVVALQGNLGAGKTTFVQALAKELGVTGTVQSPTYVLMKSYPITHEHFTTLVHIDAYRLEKPEEFAALKPEMFLQDSKNVVCIEWPEKVVGVLPAPDVVLKFSSEGVGHHERQITIV